MAEQQRNALMVGGGVELSADFDRQLKRDDWDLREQVTLTCRMLAADGHAPGLAGQVTARVGDGSYWTAPLGPLFEEVTPRDLVRIDEQLEVLEGDALPNPATRFHMWIYRRRPDVRCVIHTHPPFTSALSMLGRPLVVSHMDATPLYDECAFLAEWPGVPVADEEGDLISAALGDKRAVLLAHHGHVTVGATVQEAATVAICLEQAARMQLLAEAAGTIEPVPPHLAREAQEFLLQPSLVEAFFAAYARRMIRADPGCLGTGTE
jgi:L-fuculose-phosphate aldolase